MSDCIKLLPDVLANQIAAGEVVQRPASVVKELMENAIDAGSTQISLILKDGGKTLITIIDNGVGMSPMDARMSFERHATSKLSSARDLFAIKTMGFRGEALASIAAVAQVEMTTKRHDDEVATHIINEGNKVVSQEAVQAQAGTTIVVKNLFFNIPARRTFLKSNDVEKKHAYEEFIRLALSHPEIRFQLVYNDDLIYLLDKSSLKQRVANIFKNDIEKRLLSVEEDTEKLKIYGVIGTPQQIKKTRGDQYLFVNHRFIKSNLLNHAITSAYEKIIPPAHFPFYVLFLEIDPGSIDVNVHPTKQEIKFDDEHLIYTYLKSAVKHALSFNLVTPSFDFDKDEELSRAWNNETSTKPHIPQSTNPSPPRDNYRISNDFYKENTGRWRDLYENINVNKTVETPVNQSLVFSSQMDNDNDNDNDEEVTETEEINLINVIQLHKSFIILQVKSGMMIIDQHNAHHRILFERYYKNTVQAKAITQTSLFPETLTFDTMRAEMLLTILDKLVSVGFDIEIKDNYDFIIHGFPSFLEEGTDLKSWFEEVLDVLHQEVEVTFDFHHAMALAYANKNAISRGKELKHKEMSNLIDQLFACDNPNYDERGNSCFGTCSISEIENIIKNKI